MEFELGFIGNRLRILYRKIIGQPDIDWITKNIAIGSKTTITSLDADAIFDVRKLPEGKLINPKDIDKIVNEMSLQVCAGQRVVVHCRVGRGRSPMIVIAYLFKCSSDSLSGAVAKVRRKRPFTHLTKAQVQSLMDYREYLFSLTDKMDKEFINYIS